MEILMCISGEGIVKLTEENKIKWKQKVDERIYGLDYDYVNKKILYATTREIFEINWDKTVSFFYEIPEDVHIHTCYYTPEGNIIYTATEKDKFVVINHNKNIIFEWWAGDHFASPTELEGRDWTHINFAKKVGDNYFVTMHNHPFNKNKNGMCLHLDSRGKIVNYLDTFINKPHHMIYKDNCYYICNTGSNNVVIVDKGKFKVLHTIADKGNIIKFNNGAHQMEIINDDYYILIPNMGKLVRVSDKKTWGFDVTPGEDPRPFQFKVL